MFSAEIIDLAQDLSVRLRASGYRIATVESCTGGLVAGALTALAGSSDILDRSWVTYSNEAKVQEVGVAPALIVAHGAVSEEVACAMARGALQHAPVDLAVAVTGIAGPGGGSGEKPVGLVWIAVAQREGKTVAIRNVFRGDRAAVRLASVATALRLAAEVLGR